MIFKVGNTVLFTRYMPEGGGCEPKPAHLLYCYYFHFAGGETEARREVTCSTSHN